MLRLRCWGRKVGQITKGFIHHDKESGMDPVGKKEPLKESRRG